MGRPEVNVGVAGWTVDALWREEGVVVELDGHAAHGTSTALERDRCRDLDLRAAGFMVLRYTWTQVTEHSEAVVADLRAHLHAAPHVHREHR
jgi:very-short-patch-repair endonuclease